MLQYCRSDVDILRQACLTFRDLLMSATGEQKEIVNDKGKKLMIHLASVCMNVFRFKFIEEEWRVKLEG